MQPRYESIRVKPLAGALGAEIHDVDLSRPLPAQQLADIKKAFNDYLVIGFRKQKITAEQQVAFARNWGPLTHHPFVKTLTSHPDVLAIIRKADDKTFNFGGLWHADTTFMERPPLGSMLYAVEIPPYGGDTQFANLYMAYETLSPGMRRLADSLVVMHSAAAGYDPDRGAKDPDKSQVMQTGVKIEVTEDPRIERPHPLVVTHPDTGRKALWVTGPYCLRLQDMSEEESKGLIDYFYRHAMNPNFTFRWTWEKDSLLFWDNRCSMHFAINDYQGFHREMHRVQIGGGRPFGPALPASTHEGVQP